MEIVDTAEKLEASGAPTFAQALRWTLYSVFDVPPENQKIIFARSKKILPPHGFELDPAALPDDGSRADAAAAMEEIVLRREVDGDLPRLLREEGLAILVGDEPPDNLPFMMNNDEGSSERCSRMVLKYLSAMEMQATGAIATRERGLDDFAARLHGSMKTVEMYESQTLQIYALSKIPIFELFDAAENVDESFEDQVLRRLTQWFKRDFFSWVN